MKVWSEIQPSGGDFTFQPGERYAVLASVSRDDTLATVQAKAEAKGFTVTYAWEQGQASRNLFAIDAWLAGLSPDPTSNHRWIYAEGNFGGAAPWSLGVDPPWPFTIYHVQHVFQAVDAPDVAPGTTPTTPALPSGPECPPPSGVSTAAAVGWTLGGVLVGAILGRLVGVRL